MEYTERPSGKRVTFEDPIYIDIVDSSDEKEDLEYERPLRARKVVLWALAAAVLVFLLGGSHG
jgi:hypothetical protein